MTYQEQLDLLLAAEQGNAEALYELQQESAKMAKRANVRLSALKDKGYSVEASRNALDYLETQGRSKFSESKKLSADELSRQIEELNKFLKPETTISGARESLAGLDTLQAHEVIEDFEDDSEKRAFLRFLESDYWNDLKMTMGKGKSPTGSREALRAAQDAIRGGATVASLKSAYEDFKSREMTGELARDEDMLSIFENWAEVKL